MDQILAETGGDKSYAMDLKGLRVSLAVLKCGLQTSGISLAWELGNEGFRTPAPDLMNWRRWGRGWGGRSSHLGFDKPYRGF